MWASFFIDLGVAVADRLLSNKRTFAVIESFKQKLRGVCRQPIQFRSRMDLVRKGPVWCASISKR